MDQPDEPPSDFRIKFELTARRRSPLLSWRVICVALLYSPMAWWLIER